MSSTQLHWLTPEWLFLLPVLWFYLFWQKQSKNLNEETSIATADTVEQKLVRHPMADLLANETKDKPRKKKLNFWAGLIISSLIVAIAQPIFRGEKLPNPPPERDIVFLVDTSVSMQLKDYQIDGKAISRMDLLRQLLDKFASRMKGERISVIIFGEQSYKLVPLTNDQNLIRKMLQRITTSLAGRYSDIGSALLLGLQEANKQQDALSEKENKKRHQTFILFSDADESRGKINVHAAAELLAENDIPLFSIAIGSNTLAKSLSTKNGLYQPVNVALLEQLSKTTKGKTYRVENSDALEKAIADISKLRQNLAIQEPQFIQIPLYFYPLLFALGLLFLRQLLSVLSKKQ